MKEIQNRTELYCELLNIIQKQEEIIKQQNEIIIKLINENAEKENMINVLMSEQQD